MASPASSWVVLRRICWRSLSRSPKFASIIDNDDYKESPEYPIHRCCPTMWCRQTPPPGTWRRGSITWRNLWSSSCYRSSWRSSLKSSGCLERRSLWWCLEGLDRLWLCFSLRSSFWKCMKEKRQDRSWSTSSLRASVPTLATKSTSTECTSLTPATTR